MPDAAPTAARGDRAAGTINVDGPGDECFRRVGGTTTKSCDAGGIGRTE